MARRRKQTHDPRQLSFFDIMANQIEEIREENIQDDMREENVPAPQQRVNKNSPFPSRRKLKQKKRKKASRNRHGKKRLFPSPQMTGARDALASTAGAIPYMSCKTAPACTAPTWTSCSSLTVKKGHLKNCSRPERTTF